MRPGAATGRCLFAAATAWNAGNIGPTATSIGDDLDVSLAAIGVLGGTVFFAGLVGANLGSARLTRAAGAAAAARLSCGMALAGNVVIAVSPWFAGVGVGRLTTGFSLGLALVLGPVLARRAGGVRMVGLFGGAVTLGTAAGLGAGSVLRAAGVDWRLDFTLAAAAVGLFSVGGNLLPLAVTPAIGAAIASGDGDLAILLLAGISVLAGLANLRPAVAETRTATD